MRCPRCGAENREGAPFCSLCALRLLDSPSAYAVQHTPESSGQNEDLRFEQYPELKAREYDRRTRKRIRSLVLAGASLIGVLLLVILIVSLTHGGAKKAVGLARYRSTLTGVSFKYPSDWEKKDQAFLQKLSKPNDATSAQGNEAVLVERGEGIFKHLLVVSSGQAPALSGDWQQDKDQLESGFEQGAGNQDYEITFDSIRLPEAPQANGFGMIYVTKKAFSPTFYQLHAYIVQGGSAYQFLLCTPLVSGESDEVEARAEFSKLLGSVSIR